MLKNATSTGLTIPMPSLPANHQIEPAGSEFANVKAWSGLLERAMAAAFLVAALVAMAGWLYLLGRGLWAVGNWLIS